MDARLQAWLEAERDEETGAYLSAEHPNRRRFYLETKAKANADSRTHRPKVKRPYSAYLTSTSLNTNLQESSEGPIE